MSNHFQSAESLLKAIKNFAFKFLMSSTRLLHCGVYNCSKLSKRLSKNLFKDPQNALEPSDDTSP